MLDNQTTQIFLYNDNPISFQIGENETLINATQMAKVFGKNIRQWFDNQSTHDYIHTLAQIRGIEAIGEKGTSLNAKDLAMQYPSLIKVIKGGLVNERQQGTFLHEDIAIEFARWLNPRFGLWCNDRIKELLHFGITATDEMLVKAATDPEFVMMMIEHLKEKRKKNIELTEINSALMAQIAEDASKVDFFNNVKQLNEHDEKRKTFPISKIANMLKLSAPALNRILIRKGVISKINGHMYLNEKYKDCGYARERITQSRRLNEDTDEFEMMDITYLVWTQAGREFIINFLSELKK